MPLGALGGGGGLGVQELRLGGEERTGKLDDEGRLVVVGCVVGEIGDVDDEGALRLSVACDDEVKGRDKDVRSTISVLSTRSPVKMLYGCGVAIGGGKRAMSAPSVVLLRMVVVRPHAEVI